MKRKLFWVLYPLGMFLAILYFALRYPQFVNISIYSWFPVGYICFMIVLAVFFTTRLYSKIATLNYNTRLRLYHNMDTPTPTKSYLEKSYQSWHPLHIKLAKTIIAFTPTMTPFIFFGNDGVKIYSFVFILVLLTPLILWIGYILPSEKEMQDESKKLRQKFLEEQKREEERMWK